MQQVSSAHNPAHRKLLAGTGREDTHLLVVMTADRGLCGGFNTNIVKLARQHIQSLQREGKKVKILCVGRKGRDQLKRNFGNMIVGTVELGGVRRLGLCPYVQPISKQVLDQFDAGEADVVTVFYARFKSVDQPNSDRAASHTGRSARRAQRPPDLKGGAYEYEPDEQDILTELLAAQRRNSDLSRALGKPSVRTRRAHGGYGFAATRNAGDVIDALSTKYNRSRQAQITKRTHRNHFGRRSALRGRRS